jgi:hypothetical protein
MSFSDHISWREMLQERSLIVYWAGKGHNATIILAKMKDDFGASAPSHPWVTKWPRAVRRGNNISEPNEHSDRPEDLLKGLKVVDFLNSNP